MDNMINSAQFYTGVSDSEQEPQYESNICPDCGGIGKRKYSDCCGELIENGKCINCDDYCIATPGVCESCDGEGEL